MQNLFSWISETQSAVQTIPDNTSQPSSHLPPPDFLSIVRRSRRGRVGKTTPINTQSLTPLELRLKDLVLDLYNDQNTSSSALTQLSESEELSEIDSGNFSDRPTSHLRSLSPIATMSTTPLRSHGNNVPAPQDSSLSTVLPNFFSADDITHVSQDPQLPQSLKDNNSWSNFQFGVHGVDGLQVNNNTSLLSTYEMASSDLPLTSSSSLPLYSYTEHSNITPSTARKTTDLHSLVSQSFQLSPQTQQLPSSSTRPTPKILSATQTLTSSTPPRSLATPPRSLATPPASLVGLPHIMQVHHSLQSGNSADAEIHDVQSMTVSSNTSLNEHDIAETEHQDRDSDIASKTENESSELSGDNPQPATLQPSTPQPPTPQQSIPQPSIPQPSTPQPPTSQPPTPQPITLDEILPANPSSLDIQPFTTDLKKKNSLTTNLSDDDDIQSPVSPKDIRNRLVNVAYNPERKRLRSMPTLSTHSMTQSTIPTLPANIISSELSSGVDEIDGKERRQEVENEGSVSNYFHDVETSSVVSIDQITEALHDSIQPGSLITSHGHHERTPTHVDDDVTILHTVPLTSSPVTPAKRAHLPSKYSKPTMTPVHMTIPQHLLPAHKSSSIPLPLISDTASEPGTPLGSQPSSHSMTSSFSVHDKLSQVLHSKVHLEGKLESVMNECCDLLRERSELSSRLAISEAELEVARREPRITSSVESTSRQVDKDNVRLSKVLKELQREFKQEKMALEAAKEECSRGRVSVQQLQQEVNELKKKKVTQKGQVEELRENVNEITNKLSDEKASREEAQYQLTSLQGSYKALQDSKTWMQEQVQETLEDKIKLQEELRYMKVDSISNTFKMEQLSRENASFIQQITNLQKGVFQDKARLVNELEAIEADVMSREDSYTRLVSEKIQLVELAQQRAEEIERLSNAVGQALVERDELRSKEMERRRKEQDLLEQCRVLQKSKSEIEQRLSETETELAGRENDIEQLQRLKSSLQERLRQSDAALVSKDGALQGLNDSRDILSRELVMIKETQQRVERELEEEKRKVALLEASLAATRDNISGGDYNDIMMRSLSDRQQHLENENSALRERLSVKEVELNEKERDVTTAHTQCQETIIKYKNMQEHLHSITSERDDMKIAIVEKDSIIKRLEREMMTISEEIISCKNDRERIQSRLNATLQQKSRLEGQLAEQSPLEELEHLQVAVRERTALKKELDLIKLTHRQEILQKQARQSQLEAELTSCKRELERSQNQLEKVVKSAQETAGKTTELKNQTRSERDEMKRSLEMAKMEKLAAERQVESLRVELTEVQEQSLRLQRDVDEMREKLMYESTQRGEVERASGMVALKLKQNAEEKERQLQENNQAMSLELEQLKGRLAGILATQHAMRNHTSQLEITLAEKESALIKTSAELQRLLEEEQTSTTLAYTKINSLEQDVATLKTELTETQEKLISEENRTNELTEELIKTSHELSQIKTEQVSKSHPVLEDKIARVVSSRDELRLELTTIRAQLVVAKTAAEALERELNDKKIEMNILQQKLSASDEQYKQSNREIEDLKRQLQSMDESDLMKSVERRRREIFDTSLSTIGGIKDEDTDNSLPLTHGEI